MSSSIALLLLMLFSTVSFLRAEDLGKLQFEDRFERDETQATQDEPGNGWGTNSKSRAKGNKQVDLKDGTMRIFISAEADHAVSVTHPIEFEDGAVSMRFMLEDPKDSLGLNFADLGLKSVHAGHLCMAIVDPKTVTMRDMKTGGMRLDIYDARKAKQDLSDEQKAALKGKEKKIPHATDLGKWHDLVVKIGGETMTVSVDGAEVGSFTAPGVAHPTKKMLRLSVPRNAVIDDVKIFQKK